MGNNSFDVKDNFKRRYAGLIKIKHYIKKWENSNQLKFTNREQQMFKRMLASLDGSLSKLQQEFMIIFKDEDMKCLEKYIKNDNRSKNK